MPAYTVASSSIRHPAELEADWLALEIRAECSFFQSWGWIGPWLEHVAADLAPVAIRVHHDGLLVGLGILMRRQLRRRGIIRSNALYLNEYPFKDRNMVIEYNGLLADPAHVQAVYANVIAHIFASEPNTDEMVFGALRADVDIEHALLQSGCRQQGIRHDILEESSTWSVDLSTVGDGVDAYLGTLSKNRRAQIRRALRRYADAGPLRAEEAREPGEALVFLSELKRLHTRRWQRKGLPGVFANPRWERFHRAVIERGLPQGQIQLLRVGNAGGAVGYLYNLVWRGRVCVLQTGLQADDWEQMPGYVVHVHAIACNRAKGMSAYDLMHGDSLYKRILCNRSERLRWIVLQRPKAAFVLERAALAVVRFLRPG